MRQSKSEIETWYTKPDPWGYQNLEDDAKRKAIILKEVGELKPSSILDIGCGEGYITRDMQADMVVGVDVSSNAINRAKKSVGDRQDINFTSESFIEEWFYQKFEPFDLIVITGVLYSQYTTGREPTVITNAALENNTILLDSALNAKDEDVFLLV